MCDVLFNRSLKQTGSDEYTRIRSLNKWKSFMFWLGTSKGEKYGLHNPKFLPPDEVIEVGKSVFMEIKNNIIL